MIEIINLSVKYGKKVVYSDFNLNIGENKITCVLGESGCGKTTLLNAVAGLVEHGGSITPAAVSCVFQTPRLLPYVTVLKNLTVTGAEEDEARRLLESVGLGDRAESYPKALSGGEAQRVALCRAFAKKSALLLMDEPFSSLDLKTKLSVMRLFSELIKAEGRGALFVTHDVDEALYLADRIVVIAGGEILSDFGVAERLPFGANSPLREQIINALLK